VLVQIAEHHLIRHRARRSCIERDLSPSDDPETRTLHRLLKQPLYGCSA
jgi:hypothetical protein